MVARAGLVLATYLVFARSLANGFVYDDGLQILQNPFVLNPHLWTKIFTGSVWSFGGPEVQTNFYRPLQFFSYWLLYRLAGPNPAAFHLFQLFLYMATVWLVYRLGRELLQNEVAALAGALLWALHPLHVEAVAWVAALPEVGFGFFYLLAFLLFLRAEKTARGGLLGHGVPGLAYFPALFFKEMAISFPLMLVAYWILASGERTAGSWRGRAASWIPYLAAAGAYAAIRELTLGHLTYVTQPWKVSRREVGAAVGLLGEHTRLFFWPTHLNVFRSFDVAAILRSPWPYMTLAAVFAAVWFRKREPVLAFLVVWWVVALAPSLDIRQLSFPLLAERFSYLPSVGLCLAISYLALIWLPQRLPDVKLPSYVLPILGGVMCFWTVQTVGAIPHWWDNEVLVNYSLEQSPEAALLHVSKAVELLYRYQDLAASTQEFETALGLNRASLRPLAIVTYESYLGLGQIAFRKGRTDEAVSYFESAVRALPAYSLADDALGAVYFPRQDYAKAAEYFSKAVRLNPYDLGARFYLGTCLMKLGKYQEAAAQFRASREVDPTYWQAYEAEARALEADGDAPGAARVRSFARSR